jgi:hypothetical protein
MSVHDEILALCAEMHARGVKITYNAVRDRRGGGSRRDISRALRAWHSARAQILAETAFDRRENIATIANGIVGHLVDQMWSAMTDAMADRIRDLKMEADLIEHYADQEIVHFRDIISKQLREIDDLKAKIIRIEAELGRRPK